MTKNYEFNENLAITDKDTYNAFREKMIENPNVEVSVIEKEDGYKIYNIDIGNLPKEEAEQYLREFIAPYKKKIEVNDEELK